MRQLARVRGPLAGVVAFTLVSVLLTATVAGTLIRSAGEDPIEVTAVFEDASGLRPGDEVRIAGVRVGRVESRALVDDLAHVTFTVDAGSPLDRGVEAEVSYLNLLGQRYIALERGRRTGQALEDGDTIPVERTGEALDLTALFNAFRPLFDVLEPRDVNELARVVVAALQGEGPTMTNLLKQTAELTEHLAGRDQVIDRVVANLTLVMETTADHREEISTLVDQLGGLVHGLAEDRGEVGDALTSMQQLTAAAAGLAEDAGEPLTRDVQRLRRLGAAFNANAPLLDRALTDAPVMLEAYARSMSYGGWLNTYICSLSVKVPGEGPTVSGDLRVNSEVCQ